MENHEKEQIKLNERIKREIQKDLNAGDGVDDVAEAWLIECVDKCQKRGTQCVVH